MFPKDFEKKIKDAMKEVEKNADKVVYAPNNSGNIAGGDINQVGVGNGVSLKGSNNNIVGQVFGGGGVTQTIYSSTNNSKSTVVDNREGVMQRSNIGNSSAKSFSKCPYCGEGLNLPKTPKFCPHCGEQMTV